MKLKTWQVIFIVILAFLILVNLFFGTREVVPYYPENIFAHQYPYNVEALTDMTDASGGTGAKAKPVKDESTVTKNAVKVEGMAGKGTSTGAAGNIKEMLETMEEANKKEKKAASDPVSAAGAAAAAIEAANSPDLTVSPVPQETVDAAAAALNASTSGSESGEGFDNMYRNRLFSGPSNGEQYFGYLADASGCTSSLNSIGMSNSRGYLCLSKEQITYLQSRGGNARGKTDF